MHFSDSLMPLSADFSHIYIEEGIADHPVSRKIVKKFAKAQLVHIAHYKDLFNQKGESFRLQKRSMKLILARRDAPFLYEGSQYADGFGFERFYYTPTMFNCLYDCDYCYLQGMYASGNIVYFVNREEFEKEIKGYLHQPTLICTSYDTDLLAVEGLIGENRAWLAFAQNEPNLFLEIRTKSANFRAISDIAPNPNVVLAWTLSPQRIIEQYEHNTPSLSKRLEAVRAAIEAGWKVRLCIDPIIYERGFESDYLPLVDTIFAVINPETLFEMTLGLFRMSRPHLRSIKKMGHTPLAFYPYRVENDMASYDVAIEERVLAIMEQKVAEYLPKERIRTWRQPS